MPNPRLARLQVTCHILLPSWLGTPLSARLSPHQFHFLLQASSPTQYFWYRNTLDISTDIETPDNFNWIIAACLLVAWYEADANCSAFQII